MICGAGACVLHRKLFESSNALEQSARINDSKQLSAETRDAQYAVLMDLQAEGLIDFAVASGSVEEIAEFNILGATRLAMRRAVEALAVRADGWTLPTFQATDTLFAYPADDSLLSHSGAVRFSSSGRACQNSGRRAPAQTLPLRP